MDMLTGLSTRRSVSVRDMCGEAPTPDEQEKILSVALRVPDHGKLVPWRLVRFDKAAQKRLGEIVCQRFVYLNPDASEAQQEAERARPARAPWMVAVISAPVLGKIPVPEQVASASAVCMNLLHASHALGYGAKWLTEWIAYDDVVAQALGCKDGDTIAGFVYVGKASRPSEDRARPALHDVVRDF